MTDRETSTDLRVADFDFDLPEELIAQQPPAERGPEPHAGDGSRHRRTSRLPIRRSSIAAASPATCWSSTTAASFPRASTPAARSAAKEKSRPAASKSCSPSRPATTAGTPSSARAEKSPSAKFSSFPSPSGAIELKAEVLERGEFGDRLLQFEPVEDFFAALDRIGHIPLPPYIHRDDSAADRERYQTVYSRERGSVAAPTAGLHFTPQILDELTAAGVEIARVTLHVGLGTFAPLRVERVDDVHLHRERYTLPAATADAINRAVREGRRIVAVGTTVVRTLEHCALPGRRRRTSAATPARPKSSSRPAFNSVSCRALLTNFHLPQSSLLMLVSAFAGREPVLAAYRHAVEQRYRFFSYGDCMFISLVPGPSVPGPCPVKLTTDARCKPSRPSISSTQCRSSFAPTTPCSAAGPCPRAPDCPRRPPMSSPT